MLKGFQFYKIRFSDKLRNFTKFALALSIILLLKIHTFSQTGNFDFRTVENTSYQLYTSQSWDSLIDFGRMALKSGQDYYYLRLRIGIAFYEKGKYMQAIHQFEKALKFNKSDPVLLEYLYFAYTFTNQPLKASAITKYFPAELSHKLKTEKLKLLDNFNVEGGTIFSNNIDKNKRKNLVGRDSVYGEQDLNGNKLYYQAGINVHPARKLSVYLGYDHLATKKLKQIQFAKLDSVGSGTIVLSNHGVFPQINYKKNLETYEKNYSIYQDGFYANMNWLAFHGITITPAFHLLSLKYRNIYSTYYYETFQAQVYAPEPSIKPIYYVYENDTSFNNWVAALSIAKSISVFNFELTASRSNLNGKYQTQVGAAFTWYSAGNLDFYTTGRITAAMEGPENRYVYEQSAGFKISDRIWAEGYFAAGRMKNYNESNAFVIFNSGDMIRQRAGANLFVLLSSRFELSLRYQYLDMNGYRLISTTPETLWVITQKYQNNSLIGGLKWTLLKKI